ncbi:MAG: alpha/beta hydrolase family protein [Thermoguttaceae bacterium]
MTTIDRRSLVPVAALAWGAALLILSAPVEAVETLPDTAPLTWEEEDLSGRMMDGAHAFVDRKIAESVGRREQYWHRDFTSRQAYATSVEPNRRHLREILGAVDNRLPPTLEQFGDDANPPLVAETDRYAVYQVRWPVLEGVFGEGLWVRPKGEPAGHAVVLPDADQSPEQLLGLAPGFAPQEEWGRRLAENGFELVVPVLVDRQRLATEDRQLKNSDQTHREWIYRQAFHMGRHVVGYEVQKVLAAVDCFANRGVPEGRIGVAGYGEGGLVAFYAAALDVRISASLVSGYFGPRQAAWSEPIYRNVWSLLREFGDAETASLILPRSLVVEYGPCPQVTDQKGEIKTPSLAEVTAELDRLPAGLRPWGGLQLVHGEGGATIGPGSVQALEPFARALGAASPLPLSGSRPADRRQAFEPAARHDRAVRQLEGHVQRLVDRSEHIREQFFLHSVMPELADWKWNTDKQRPTHDAAKFIEGAKALRDKFRTEGIGAFDEPLLPPNARSRKILENQKWTAWDVVLDVYPELFAWGVLVIPNDIRPGERRPVVVCQHGRNGLPRDTIDKQSTAYNDFAARLAERGFVTFAPHNLYRGEDRYRWLDRKANTVKATLFSFIVPQHEQILRWLASQPFVDGDRIAFYGLSYGGETAVRVPPLVEGYCLSICSGDFNQWTRKVADTSEPFSFMRTIEWEMPYWNLGQTFDYAEMAYLMVPRPFMVERGHLDAVGRDQWVAHEYAKVRWLYAQLGLEDRTRIEFFQGGHSINGQGTFEFLQEHLRGNK